MGRSCTAVGVQMVCVTEPLEDQPLAPVPHDKSQSPPMFSGKNSALPASGRV